MKKLKSILVVFDDVLHMDEVPMFRAAVIEKAGRQNMLFHHHAGNNKLLHRYPLIQYKHINGQAAILGFEEGADAILELLDKRRLDVTVGRKKKQLNVASLKLNYFHLNVWVQSFTYRITGWIALNEKNYALFPTITTLKERVAFLEKTLVAHILSFAEGVEWSVEKEIEISINDICKQRWVKYKGVSFMAFDVLFSANVSLPNYVGMGKAVSVGFGEVQRIRTRSLKEKQPFLKDINAKKKSHEQTSLSKMFIPPSC